MLADIDEYGDFNTVYAQYFDAATAPARAAYQVSALPKNARAEVKCTATWDSAPPVKCHAGRHCATPVGCVTSCPMGPDGPQSCIDAVTKTKC